MKGLFITLEGPDGSGKSTLIKNLKKKFQQDKIDLVLTREPGGSPIGEEIREIILKKENTDLGHETEALLYAASRAQHIHQIIQPALERGSLVISDRFLLSSLAYQGVGRGLGIEEVKAINDFGLRGIEPDLILFFHIDPAETLRRKTINNGGDRLEREGDKFHKLVYKGYMDIVDRYPGKIKILDATKTREELADLAYKEIKKLLTKGEN